MRTRHGRIALEKPFLTASPPHWSIFLPPERIARYFGSAVLVSPTGKRETASVARERRLGAREVEEIFSAFAEAMRELPPDVEAGWLDAQGDLRLAPDIARKLRTARRVRQLLLELRQREREA